MTCFNGNQASSARLPSQLVQMAIWRPNGFFDPRIWAEHPSCQIVLDNHASFCQRGVVGTASPSISQVEDMHSTKTASQALCLNLLAHGPIRNLMDGLVPWDGGIALGHTQFCGRDVVGSALPKHK
jgi:hypothetical protein